MPHKAQQNDFYQKCALLDCKIKPFFNGVYFLALFSHMEHSIHLENDMIINSLSFLEIACPAFHR